MANRLTESDIDHDEEVARIDGNYLARKYIDEVRKWRAIAERDHGKPIAADLTSEDREALGDARACVRVLRGYASGAITELEGERALAVLDRLLGGTP